MSIASRLPKRIRIGKGSYWEPNRRGLNQFAESQKFQAALERRAKRILDAYDPRMSGADSSAYTFIEEDPTSAAVLVGTRFPFAHLDEWGSVNNPPYGSMRKAATRAGFRFKPTGKGG